jgi:hypothetical protein
MADTVGEADDEVFGISQTLFFFFIILRILFSSCDFTPPAVQFIYLPWSLVLIYPLCVTGILWAYLTAAGAYRRTRVIGPAVSPWRGFVFSLLDILALSSLTLPLPVGHTLVSVLSSSIPVRLTDRLVVPGSPSLTVEDCPPVSLYIPLRYKSML